MGSILNAAYDSSIRTEIQVAAEREREREGERKRERKCLERGHRKGPCCMLLNLSSRRKSHFICKCRGYENTR